MKQLLCLGFLFFSLISCAQEEVIFLYPNGPAPGSEEWTWKEAIMEVPGEPKNPRVYNVVNPSLTVYRPSKTNHTKTAVILAPGGGFHYLAIQKEGTDVAEWLQKRGITVFLLKYRLNRTFSNDPVKELAEIMNKTEPGRIYEFGNVIELAMQDGLKAVTYVREHSEEFNIDPEKIGFMGFSAGGTVTMSVAMNSSEENKPNFIAPIYAYFGGAIKGQIPTEEMPAFICAATDDGLKLAPQSIEIYENWVEAGQEAELHIYETGGHGFGMRKLGGPTDFWIKRFGEWLWGRDLLPRENLEKARS